MKQVLSIAFLGLAALSSAQASTTHGPDQMTTVVSCRNTSRLPSGLFLQIRSGGFAGITVAQLSNRDNLGPVEDLGSIGVRQKPVPAGVMGAGVTYLGQDFELHINTDSPGENGEFNAHVYADIKGRVFNEPMLCNFPSQPE